MACLTYPERRGQPRRAADRTADGLQQTLNSCLERIADGVVLLNSEARVIYATLQAEQFGKIHETLFSLSPSFTPCQPTQAARFAAFVSRKNKEAGPLSLLLESGNGNNQLLLNCFQLAQSTEPGTQAARYLITLRDPNHYSVQHWLLFCQQFQLTQAETRLCRALANGLTLNDYCRQWGVTVSTARSQLKSVFGKTSTRRQSDLLRLIFLFTRS